MELGNIMFGNSRGIYEVPRGHFEERFNDFLEAIGCDGYGYCKPSDEHKNIRGGIKTSVFEINPYYWGDDEEEMTIHNFIYYTTRYELDWYKYPLRDSYSNKQLAYDEFSEMLDRCEEAYNGNK